MNIQTTVFDSFKAKLADHHEDLLELYSLSTLLLELDQSMTESKTLKLVRGHSTVYPTTVHELTNKITVNDQCQRIINALSQVDSKIYKLAESLGVNNLSVLNTDVFSEGKKMTVVSFKNYCWVVSNQQYKNSYRIKDINKVIELVYSDLSKI